MELKEYIDLKLVHSVHTSGRKSFRSCRRRWYWTNVEMYYPRTTPAPLEFGVAFHAAMEKFYEPLTWHQDIKIRQSLAMMQFKQASDEQIKNYKRMNGELDLAKQEEYENRLTLGLHMIKYYTENVSRYTDVGFTPVEVELPFEIAILSPEGEAIWCKCKHCWRKYSKWLKSNHPEFENSEEAYWQQDWQGLPVTYGGRLDMLAVDELGRYWVYDWKALGLDVPILTINGWVKMGDLSVGDRIIGSNGNETTVVGVYPQGEKEVFEVVTTDGGSVEATAEHLWTVERLDTGKQKIMTTAELIVELAKKRPKYTALPELSPVQFSTKDLPLDPYALGLLLGDGGMSQRSIRFSNSDGLEKYLPFDCTELPDNQFIVKGAVGVIKQLGLYGNLSIDKFIPDTYKFGDVAQRLALLQGLLDTDGYVSKGNAIYCTSSTRLRDDVVALVQSLGGKALVFNDGLRHNATTESFQISIKLPSGLSPFKANIAHKLGRWRKGGQTHRRIIKSITPTRTIETQCIRVDASDKLFVTKDFILTHNTTSRILDEDAESSFLTLDDQVSSYLWALRSLGLNVVGFVYVEIRKAYPSPPKELSRLYKGRKFSTSKTEFSTPEQYRKFVEENDPLAYAQGLYDEHIGWLKSEGPKFHQRHQIHKNDKEIEMAGYNIWLEAQDMTQNPRIYPQPGRFSCNTCLFKQPCIGMNQGEDYVYTLDSMFDKQEKHYYELVDEAQEKKRSTEKPSE